MYDVAANLIASKQALRQQQRDRRAALAQRAPAAAADRLASHALAALQPRPGLTVAFYQPLSTEISPLPLAKALAEQGCALALPVIVAPDTALVFCLYQFGDPLTTGPLGVQEPSTVAPAVRPDWLLVPLLAFDRNGGRLGYGGGYYDRSLQVLRAGMPVLAVGLAYAEQELAAVPTGPQDARLDAIVTEQAFIQVNTTEGPVGPRHR